MKGKFKESHIRHIMLVHVLGIITGPTGVDMRGTEGPWSKGQSFSIGSWEDSPISVQGKKLFLPQ